MQPLPRFQQKLKDSDLFPLKPKPVEIFQINLGKQCNQTCRHCHVDAGPDRREIMSRETLEKILIILQTSKAKTVDLTGGAPEMNPDFRWFVGELAKLEKKVIVRCNLTIILANKKYNDLPEFFKKHRVHVISSLPFYEESRTDRQRGGGVFATSIKALKLLNAVGYGKGGTQLYLDLVYNPAGAFLPGSQQALQIDFKRELKKNFDIEFNNLLTITNMPISRYLDFLIASKNYETYMEKLVNAYNPRAAEGVMCRNMISIGWDGKLFDCDFNQMLELNISNGHIDYYDEIRLGQREIIFGQHCYGCTAGAGSSCGGEIS